MRKGRPLAPLSVTVEDRTQLVSWSKRPKTAQALAMRSRIVLLAGDGLSNTVIASQLHTMQHTVGKWRRRYLESGLDGLLDEPRPGTSHKLSDREVERVLALTLESTPADATHWSTRSLAKQPDSAVTPFIASGGPFPWRRIAPDIQVLPRPAVHRQGARYRRSVSGSSGARPGAVCGREEADTSPGSQRTAAAHAPRTDRTPHPRLSRHGTTSLFAALEHKDRQADRPDPASPSLRGVSHFPRYHRGERAAELDMHLILDNYGTHKTATDPRLAGEEPTLSSALHAYFGQLAQPGRTLVCCC